MQDGQMILIGGYSGDDAACEPSSGIYIFDASSLQWIDSFTPADHPADYHAENSVLAGSYGYKVPPEVQNVVGGDSSGGASATTPAAGPAASGPFATGKPPVFTVTQSAATQTITSPGGTQTSSSNSDHDNNNNNSTNSASEAGLISAGVIAGIAGMLALYLGFCAILYRRQIKAYKHHLAISNHYYAPPPPPAMASESSGPGSGASAAAAFIPRRTSHFSNSGSTHYGGYGGGEWDDTTPWLTEPKWMTDEDGEEGGGSGSGRRTIQSSSGSRSSSELFEGGEPSFFSVVMAPRRALRVVNGTE